MSASEKLKALERGKYVEGRERQALHDVLPQITAVVEAAARAQRPIGQGQRAMLQLGWTHSDVTAIPALADALAALDEALS